jgi:cytochrome b561
LKNSTSHYGWLTIVNHWLSACIVVGMFALGLWMVELDFYNQWYHDAPHYHKSVGLLFSLLILFRLVCRWVQTTPQPLTQGWQSTVAGIVHKLFYLLFFAIFFSGYLISTAEGRGIEIFSWFTVPALEPMINNQEDIAGEWHRWLVYSLIALSAIHALAALKHHFINKDLTLVRMLKPTLPNKEQE